MVLARPVVPVAFAISHPRPQEEGAAARPSRGSSAPAKCEVWVSSTPTTAAAAAAAARCCAPTLSFPRSQRCTHPIALVQGVLASHASSETVAQQVVQNGTMVKLAEFEYNVESTDVMQRFPVELSEVRRTASRRLSTLSINTTATNTDPRCPPPAVSAHHGGAAEGG